MSFRNTLRKADEEQHARLMTALHNPNRGEPSKSELRAMLNEAVKNTAAMPIAELPSVDVSEQPFRPRLDD